MDISDILATLPEAMQFCVKVFSEWPEEQQTNFVKILLTKMCHQQHICIDQFLRPMLQRDFISGLAHHGLIHISEHILSLLDAESLKCADLVCTKWKNIISNAGLWKKLIERNVHENPLWHGLAVRRGWLKLLLDKSNNQNSNHLYRQLYSDILRDISTLEHNWQAGKYRLQKIQCHNQNSKGVYCFQYDDKKIISGLRDNTIKIWDKNNLNQIKVLTGHAGSVLCLQYDDNVIITGSSDSTIRVWSIEKGTLLNTIVHHAEAVLHLRFQNGVMVTSSKDRSIAVWDMRSSTDITLRRVLVGHRAAVNAVDFDEKYIATASGDRTIKIWDTNTCDFIRTLNGHKRGIACLQYKDNLIVSGSSDNTIRLWDADCGTCIRVLEGHEELVRCIRFDSKRIISGAYDGKIKVWDLQAALDLKTPSSSLCIRTLVQHTGRVFRLQFDDFQIVSSSHDDSILIWNFLDPKSPIKETLLPSLSGTSSPTLPSPF